jgi:hypothetical protein
LPWINFILFFFQSDEYKYNKTLYIEKAKQWTRQHAVEKNVSIRFTRHLVGNDMNVDVHESLFNITAVLLFTVTVASPIIATTSLV